jgi:hypothetical protein
MRDVLVILWFYFCKDILGIKPKKSIGAMLNKAQSRVRK